MMLLLRYSFNYSWEGWAKSLLRGVEDGNLGFSMALETIEGLFKCEFRVCVSDKIPMVLGISDAAS